MKTRVIRVLCRIWHVSPQISEKSGEGLNPNHRVFDATMKNSESRRISFGRVRRIARTHASRTFQQAASSLALISMLATSIPVPAQQAQETPMQQPAAAAPVERVPPAPGLPPAPQPNYTTPLYMRPRARDFSKENWSFPNYLKTWEPTT